MSAQVEFGSVREVWFATLASPSTKYSFLIRDDAYSKSGATASRSVRLGDPINTGPNSAWTQTTWEGGRDQDAWRDEAMYADGNADVTSQLGQVQMWPGVKWMFGVTAPDVTGYTFCTGTTGVGVNIPLFFAGVDRANRVAGTAHGGNLYKYDDSTGVTTLLQSIGSSVMAMASIADQGNPGQFLAITTADGRFMTYWVTGDTLSTEVTGLTAPSYRGIVAYGDATYYLAGKTLRKRTWTSPGPAVHTDVKVLADVDQLTGIAV